jgi:hypothetical protein
MGVDKNEGNNHFGIPIDLLPSGLYTGLDSPFSSYLTGLMGGFFAMIFKIPQNIGSIVK